MRQLAIAYGNSRQAKKWINKTVSFDDLKERLRVPIRTTETAEEYAKMTRAQRDAAKDHGGFVAAVLEGGKRRIDAVVKRSMLVLDGDRIEEKTFDTIRELFLYAFVLYSTHSSTKEQPRVRIIIPLSRDVTPEEFAALSRYAADMLGIDQFDECSYQPNQIMYWPSCPSNGEYIYMDQEGEWLDPDEILAEHPEWKDPSKLPTSSRESSAKQTLGKRQKDPLEKEGLVGNVIKLR